MIYTYYKQYGNTIFLRYKKGRETITTEFKEYRPRLYTPTDKPNTDFTSIYGTPLHEMRFDDIKSAKEFCKQYEGVDNFRIEGNSRFDNQFVIELLGGQTPNYIAADIKGHVIDIEVDVADGEGFPEPDVAEWPINAITTYITSEAKFVTFALKSSAQAIWYKERSPQYLKDMDIEFVHCDTEHELLTSYLEFLAEDGHPDFTSGWNSELFDMPYLVTRMKSVVGAKMMRMLSPYGKVMEKMKTDGFGKPKLKVEIIGVPHLDYMELYKKHIFTPRESYKLNFIAEAEVHEKKIDYKGSLHQLYLDDFQTFMNYNIHDVNLIRLLEAKLGLFQVTFALAYYTLANYEDTLGTVKIWEELAAKHLFTVKQVPLFRKEKGIERDYEGAFVHPVAVGKHGWTFSIDLNSLYPHNEIQYNIGLETSVAYQDLPEELQRLADQNFTIDDLVECKVDTSALLKYNYAMAPNKQFYRKDKQSFFAVIKEGLYANRKSYKKTMLKAEQDLVNIKEEMHKRGLFTDD